MHASCEEVIDISIILYYVIGVNIVTLLLWVIDRSLYDHHSEKYIPIGVLELLTIFGGSLATSICAFALDRTPSKKRGDRDITITMKVFAIAMLVIHVVLLLFLFGIDIDFFKTIYQTAFSEYGIHRYVIAAYLLIINVITFVLFYVDKQRAIKNQWRIKIKTLLLLCAVGGSIGGMLGMIVFRHKIRRPYFNFGVPMIIVAQIALFVYLKYIGVL